MTDGNPIVAAAEGKVSPLEGLGMFQDLHELQGQVDSGQWAGGLVSLLSLGLNMRDTFADPMAKLISMGLGWVIEFFDPLNAWLDWLTCDQEQLTVAAETWSGISAELRTAADELDGYYKTDTAGWSGPAVDQYRLFCADRVKLYEAAAGAAAVTANLINSNKGLLTMVRSIVRDLITEGVGKVISIVLRYPPPTTPAAAGEIAGQVTRTGNAIADLVRKLQQAFKNAKQMLRQSGNIFKEAGVLMERMKIITAGAARASRHLQNSDDVLRAYNRSVGHVLGLASDVAKYSAKNAGIEAAASLPEKVFVETVKETTKNVEGRVDESAPEHPAVEEAKERDGRP